MAFKTLLPRAGSVAQQQNCERLWVQSPKANKKYVFSRVCVCVATYAYCTNGVVRDNFVELIVSFHLYMHSRDGIQVTRLAQ